MSLSIVNLLNSNEWWWKSMRWYRRRWSESFVELNRRQLHQCESEIESRDEKREQKEQEEQRRDRERDRRRRDQTINDKWYRSVIDAFELSLVRLNQVANDENSVNRLRFMPNFAIYVFNISGCRLIEPHLSWWGLVRRKFFTFWSYFLRGVNVVKQGVYVFIKGVNVAKRVCPYPNPKNKWICYRN
jgi:hypothetical protein